ncbi:MAG: leucyl aminopeptidase [Planctomycetes bacterium]|nr:leucyl aminopeptidase [Planctomycetota bacterium]
MDIQFETTASVDVEADWLIACLPEDEGFTAALDLLDSSLGGKLTRLRESGDLSGKLAETLAIHDVPGIEAQRLLLVGLGKADELDIARLNKAMLTAARKISEKDSTSVAVLFPDVDSTAISAEEAARTMATALTVGCVGQGLFRQEPGRFEFVNAKVLLGENVDQTSLQEELKQGGILGEAINLTRELVNRPAQEIYPESFAARAEQVASECGLNCQVLDEDQLKQEKMGSMSAVAQGSDRPPRLVVLEHKGGGDDAATLALVGKGVTFDSGGLSIKTNEGMKTMKCDMAGAATVLGAMSAIARLKLPVNVTGYMGLVENMISGNSYKLGDVLTARNGVTIEVLNTDAEGRLVLADVLCYAADHGADKIIDLATLTGACVVALGEEVTGVFSNNSDWCDSVLNAANATGEQAWQMPMFDEFADQLKSDVADCKNVGTRWGGAITAAKFLQKFVDDTPWVHLDIAGPSFASGNKGHREGGATGCMLKTLVETARNLQKI